MKVTAAMKICSACKEEKPFEAFAKNCRTKDGYKYQCKACIKLTYYANHDVEKAKRKVHYEANKTRYKEWSKLAKRKGREKYYAYNKKWWAENKAKSAAYTAKYKTQRRLAMPKWANEFFIEEAYHLAHLRTKLTGFPWHVDHIVPLRGKNVCGLHVEHNLQVIPAKLNSQKSNKFESH